MYQKIPFLIVFIATWHLLTDPFINYMVTLTISLNSRYEHLIYKHLKV